MPPVSPTDGQPPAKPVVAKVEQPSEFTESEQLETMLRQLPDVRREEVLRAAQLVENHNYPPPEMIRRLARLFAQPGQVEGE